MAGWAGINSLALFHNPKDSADFHSGRWSCGTNPVLTFATVDSNTRLPDRHILEKFPRSQHRLSLITPPRFALPVPSMPVKRWNFRKAKWSHYIALTNKFAKAHHPIHRTWIRSTRTFARSSAHQPKDLSHVVVEATSYHAGMQNVRTSTKCSCDLLMETTLAGLPQLYSLGSTRNRRIDVLKQFSASTFYTPAEKHGVS